MQRTIDNGYNNLFQPTPGTGSVTGAWTGESLSYSWYTRHVDHYPHRKLPLLGALGCAAWLALRPRP